MYFALPNSSVVTFSISVSLAIISSPLAPFMFSAAYNPITAPCIVFPVSMSLFIIPNPFPNPSVFISTSSVLSSSKSVGIVLSGLLGSGISVFPVTVTLFPSIIL